jgi:hypothetical protein
MITKRFFLLALTFVSLSVSAQQKSQANTMASPDGHLSVTTPQQGITISRDGCEALQMPKIGIEGFAAAPRFTYVGKVQSDYQMLSGKRSHCANEANEYQWVVADGKVMKLRLYNDGVAFRYEFSNITGDLPRELSTYRIAEGTRRWIMQWGDGAEGFYPLTTSYKTAPERSFSGVWKSADGWNTRWGYPALIQSADNVFVLLSEANIERQQSASCLYNEGEFYRVVADQNESKVSGAWHTPWRVAIIGSLADVVESTLITDVSEPCQLADTNWIHPGVVSWVYWAYNHGSNDMNIIQKYVDLAVALKLPYVLIDAEWDTMKDGKTVEDAVKYALDKGIKPMIWYNSSVGWIDGAPTPKFRLNKPEDREKEFAWCEKIGVAGVKIDFFSGENLKNMDFCLDLMESAAAHHLLVNFHGATIPRGWQRTYPNLLSTEGVYGAEWYNNVGTFTKQAACHNATLPFTRNVIGPMDYTPCAFSDSQHPHITSHGHELALTVLFESGLQHLADRPESFLAQPKEVQQFLGNLPAAWDETRFVSGYPGESVVLARRSGDIWYVAGINGKDEAQTLQLPLSFVSGKQIQLFADGEPWNITTLKKKPASLDCQPRGGFVMIIK